MRKLLALLAALVLTSCIDVQDMGGYWAKGILDPALEGTWEQVNDKLEPGADAWRFVKADATYALQKIKAGVKDDQELVARSLELGPYHFLMVTGQEEKGGTLCRYAVKDGRVEQYFLNNEAVLKWLKATYPKAKNIGIGSGGELIGSGIRIKVMDDEVAKVLAALPDTPDYWEAGPTYKKVP